MDKQHQKLLDAVLAADVSYVDGEYINANSVYKLVCEVGHKFDRSWRSIVHQRRLKCPLCEGRYFNTEYISELLAKDEYGLVGEYKNASTKMQLVCPKGHKISMLYSNYSKGHRCKICADTKNSDIDVDFSLQKSGYIRNSQYMGIFEPLNMTCPSGHSISMAYNDFKKGSRCGVCYNGSKHNFNSARSFALSLGYEFQV